MKKMFWMGLGLSLLVAACGKKGDPDAPKGGICDHTDEGTCEEFKSSALGLAEGFCKAAGGTYVKDKACPKENLLGNCAKESGDKHMFYAGNGKNMTAEDAKKECESNSLSKGKWTDGPAAATSKERKAPDAAKIKASCDKSEEIGSSCDDYSVADALDLNKSMCEGMKGKYEKKPCPTDKLVGSCVFPTGRTTRYYVPKKDNAFGMSGPDHKKDCEMEMLGQKGFWIDGPEFNTKPAAGGAPTATPPAGGGGGGGAKPLPGKPATPTKPATPAKPAGKK